jgi:hypothetical protein
MLRFRERKSPDIRHYHLKSVAGEIREILDILNYKQLYYTMKVFYKFHK